MLAPEAAGMAFERCHAIRSESMAAGPSSAQPNQFAPVEEFGCKPF